jgi:hypothetical protein
MSSAFEGTDTRNKQQSQSPGLQSNTEETEFRNLLLQGKTNSPNPGMPSPSFKESDSRFGQPPVYQQPLASTNPPQGQPQPYAFGDLKPTPVLSDANSQMNSNVKAQQGFAVQPSMVVSSVPMPANGRHTRTFPNGSVYSGDFRDGKRHGQGRQQWQDGAVYEGSWMDDKIHGSGQLSHGNGDQYTGAFVSNSAQGQGKYLRYEGGEYIGEWANDRQNGKGLEVSPDGDRYEGAFKAGKKEGYGIYQWSNGCKYDGQWSNNRINGEVGLNFK